MIRLAVEHILIAKQTFSSFEAYDVSKKFYELLADQYNDDKLFHDLDQAETNTLEQKTDSAVDPDTTKIGDVSLMELLSI